MSENRVKRSNNRVKCPPALARARRAKTKSHSCPSLFLLPRLLSLTYPLSRSVFPPQLSTCVSQDFYIDDRVAALKLSRIFGKRTAVASPHPTKSAEKFIHPSDVVQQRRRLSDLSRGFRAYAREIRRTHARQRAIDRYDRKSRISSHTADRSRANWPILPITATGLN